VRRRDIAAGPGITERSACGIITGLTAAGYAVKQKDGRRSRYQIQAHLPLPGPASQQPAIGDVLALVAGARARLRLTGTGTSPGTPQLSVHACTPAGGRRRAPRTAASGQGSAMGQDTGVHPGPAFPQANRGAHTIAALSGEYGIASVPAPRATPPACPLPPAGSSPACPG